MKTVETERMSPAGPNTNPVTAAVTWHPIKSLWYSSHVLLGIVGVFWFFDWISLAVCGFLTVVTLCCGHTVGLHRLLVHRNLVCPPWLERVLVYLGTLVGMGGPFGMIYLHDIRDWAQRHRECHPFFTHQSWIGKDWWWNLHCRIRLENSPIFQIEPEAKNDPFYRFLQGTWMAQQIPLALILFLLGGWGLVLWGISARLALSLTGHWLIGYLAHNQGHRDWHLHGHAVQGFNLPGLGLLTMGESWHNNHHAYPDSARLGMEKGQTDPGWWFVQSLACLGLAKDIRTPEMLPHRPGRERLSSEFNSQFICNGPKTADSCGRWKRILFERPT